MSTTARKRQLIFAWPYVEWGGAQIYLMAIMKLAKHDWDILVLLPRDSSAEMVRHLDDLNVRYEFTDTHSDLSPAPGIVRKFNRQRRRIHDLKVLYRRLAEVDLQDAVIHIEVAPWQDWIFLTLLSFKGANFFVTMHNFPAHASKLRACIWWLRLQFVSRLRGFHIFASNKDTRNKLKGWVSNGFYKRIPVTYTCVDPEQIQEVLDRPFVKADRRRMIGIGPQDQVVLCVGQFIDRKGRWTFLEAARRVLDERQDVSFVWVSTTPPTAKDQEKIDSFGLGSAFRLIISADLGDRSEVLSFFLIADIYVQPSLLEGLPIALLEAMGLGLPVISTKINAIPEAVRDRETGLLVEPGDAIELARTIIGLINDRDLQTKISAAGREFVLEHFDERVASRIAIKAYEESFAHG